MKHVHVWTWGSPNRDWQVCRECGKSYWVKPDNDEEN
jgi:uncharacterized protein with PIN domain